MSHPSEDIAKLEAGHTGTRAATGSGSSISSDTVISGGGDGKAAHPGSEPQLQLEKTRSQEPPPNGGLLAWLQVVGGMVDIIMFFKNQKRVDGVSLLTF